VNEAVDHGPPVESLEEVLLLDQFEDKDNLAEELRKGRRGATDETFIDKDVQPERDVEPLVVDPLLKSEHRTVVYLKLRLRPLQQFGHSLVQLAEIIHELRVVFG
jgi:hypothetical protein